MKNKQLWSLLVALFGIGLAITIYWRCSNREVKEPKFADLYVTFGNSSSAALPASVDTPVNNNANKTANQTSTDTPGTSGTTGNNTASPTQASQASSYIGGGPCSESGICQTDSTLNNMYSILTNFQYDEKDNVLIMSLPKDSVKKKHPTHLRYFEDPSRLYKFGSTYSLATPFFSKLGLPPNSRIRPEDTCLIQDEKDGRIIVRIKFSHD